MSNIYKEVFLAALTGLCANPEASLVVEHAEELANEVWRNEELMAKLADDKKEGGK